MSHKKLVTILISIAVLVLVPILIVFLYRWEPSATTEPEPSVLESAAQEEVTAPSAGKTEANSSEHIAQLKAALPEPPNVYIGGWRFLYVDTDHGVGRYSPELVDVDGQYFDARVADEARNFLADARDQGYEAYISVGYRNFDYGMYWYDQAILQYGSAYKAAKHVDPPGTTEHSTGLSFDISDESRYAGNYSTKYDKTVLDTELYKWMAEHCQEYGFIVRYPEGKEEFFKNPCHPGHFRYVGVEAATYIMENDLCLEEFLALYE